MDEYASPGSDVSRESPALRTFELQGVAVLSAGRLMAGFYGAIALVFGGLYGAFAVVGSVIGAAVQQDPTLLVGALFGLVFAILMPLMYAVFGLIGGVIMAVIYNFAAGRLGGLELRLVDRG
jgi:hypothetical protein